MALAYRLQKLELLSEWRHSETGRELAQVGHRESEPNSAPVREGSQLPAKVPEALRQQDVTPVTLAGDPVIPLEELTSSASQRST
jgi:hypothetical protein